MWKSIAEPGRPQMTIWRMHFACWINNATNTHSEFEVLIVFPPQQLLHERASMLRYMYVACLVYIQNITRNVHVMRHIHIPNQLHAITDVCCMIL